MFTGLNQYIKKGITMIKITILIQEKENGVQCGVQAKGKSSTSDEIAIAEHLRVLLQSEIKNMFNQINKVNKNAH